MGRTLNRKALSEALGDDPALITRWTKRGMPHDTVAGHCQYDLEECRAWKVVNIRPRADLKRQKQPTPLLETAVAPAAPAVQALATPPAAPIGDPAALRLAADDPLLVALLSSDPRQQAQAAVGIATRQVGVIAQAGGVVGPQQLDSIKKSLEEMRRTEEAWMELAEKRGELIPRDVARAVAGAMAQRLKDALDRFINSLATQFEMWNQDAAFSLPANTAGRAREIRAWAESQARDVRSLEAAEIDKLIEKERTEEGAA